MASGHGLSLAGTATSIIFSRHNFSREKHVFFATKHVFCRDKSMLVAAKLCLTRQNIVVATNICCDIHNFVATKVLSGQAYKTCLLSRQKHACQLVTKRLARQAYFVATKDVFCRGKHIFVATKSILVAALANDNRQ